MRKSWKFVAPCTALLLSLGPAQSQEIPSSLLQHSIVLSWSERRTFEPAGGVGMAHEDVVNGKGTIYLETAGHILSRVEMTVSASKDGKSLGDRSSVDSTTWTWSLDRQGLNGYTAYKGGVQRISISVHGRSGNCSIQSTYGKSKGNDRFVVLGWQNESYYLVTNRLAGSSCAIQSGNALSN
jgi:hypothetical protein